MPQAVRQFFAEAVEYAEQVVSGQIPNSKWVIAACQRFLDDLQKETDPLWPFRFDEAKAVRVCQFCEALPHIKGPKVGEKLRLDPWQCWFICNVFGFVTKSTGKRRFRKAYLECPRGSGKSFLLSAIGLYMLSADGEGGSDCYVAGRTREQTKAVFETAQAIVRHSPALSKKLGMQVTAHAIVQRETVSAFRSLASDSQSLDGLNIHCAIVDELHAARTRDVFDTLETGCQKRAQSLLIAITTAGSDREGIGYEIHTYVQKLLDKVVENESFFGCIYTIADGMDWRTEEAWICANPSWYSCIDQEGIRQLAKKATQIPSSKPAFISKHLNVWVNSDSVWIPAEKLQRCVDQTLKESDFAGMPCHVGIDLASRLDLCAAVRLYTRQIEGKDHFYAFGNYFLPSETAEASQYSASFGVWAEAGHLIITPGTATDLDFIETNILETAKQAKVQEVAYDQFLATMLVQHLSNEGLTCVEVPQTVRTMSPAMKMLEEAVAQGRFHLNDPVLLWCISNTVCHRDQKDNLFPNKDSKNSQRKIDGLVALLFAVSRLIVTPLEEASVYTATRGLIIL